MKLSGPSIMLDQYLYALLLYLTLPHDMLIPASDSNNFKTKLEP